VRVAEAQRFAQAGAGMAAVDPCDGLDLAQLRSLTAVPLRAA
jgi:hypothetical protein